MPNCSKPRSSSRRRSGPRQAIISAAPADWTTPAAAAPPPKPHRRSCWRIFFSSRRPRIAGPEDNIFIPKNADSIFPEFELCVVIGKKVRNLSKAQAFDADLRLHDHARCDGARLRARAKTCRGTRSVRKGFETFAPIGPWITTKDEIADPHNLWMKLWINGELKQSAKTDAMINDIATQISFLSQVTTSLSRRFADDRQSGLTGVPRETRSRRCPESRDRRHRRHEPRRGQGKLVT